MKLLKGQRVEVKGELSSWKEFVVYDDFDTGDTRWKLLTLDDKRLFEPLGVKCKIRIIDDNGRKRLVKYKSDSEVWSVINEQISRSRIKRYPWNVIFGESLTKVILRHKMKGFSSVETFNIILEYPMIVRIMRFFPEHRARLVDKIKISVASRYGENDSALSLYNKEFRNGRKNE